MYMYILKHNLVFTPSYTLTLVLVHYTTVLTKIVPQKCLSVCNNANWAYFFQELLRRGGLRERGGGAY